MNLLNFFFRPLAFVSNQKKIGENSFVVLCAFKLKKWLQQNLVAAETFSFFHKMFVQHKHTWKSILEERKGKIENKNKHEMLIKRTFVDICLWVYARQIDVPCAEFCDKFSWKF